MAKDNALTGAAGAYYVAFQLSVQEYAVGLTTYGTKAIDLIVANPETGKSITIQTKTGSNAFVQSRKWGSCWNWRVGTRRADPYPTFFYAFVDLKGDPSKTPDVFIVPSDELSPLLVEYKEKGGERVTDVWCGIDEEDAPKYRNKWELIERALV